MLMARTVGDDTASPAVAAEAKPVALVRYRRGAVGETARTVHVVSPPAGGLADVVGARCGAVLVSGDLETVALGEGMPCLDCVLQSVTDAVMAETPPSRSLDCVDTVGPASSGITYQQWGWPVTLRRDQVLLNLEGAVSAWMIPARWYDGVISVLIQRRCAPPVLAHPYAPEHHIVLTGEKFGPRLPWPRDVCQVSGGLLLPPTLTPRGLITWIMTPRPDSLRLCREIDLFAALRNTAGGQTLTRSDPP